MMFRKHFFFSFLIAFVSVAAQANVSLKNGNFFMGYTDVYYPGGFEPKIERVYNSKTSYKGILGWGWGNEYEVYLKVSADGSVVVYEYGGGAENRFSPKSFSESEITAAVDKIAAVAQSAGVVGTTQQLAQYKKHLKDDAGFRNDEWQKFIREGRLQPRDLKEGTQLYSNVFSFQYITKVKNGYVRSFDTGKVEFFDERGKLVKVADKNNNYISLSYGKDGRLQKIQDNFNRKIMFTFNQAGLLEKIVGDNNKVATYKYNNAGELIETKDAAGNVYKYKYTSDGYHNLAEIDYSDKTKLEVAYYGQDKFMNVKRIKDRDGRVTEYDYMFKPGDRLHYTVSVKMKSGDGKEYSQSSYEYQMRTKASGEEWTYRLVTSIDGDRTETTYNECCGLPLLIKRGKDETSFVYDTKGHVVKKTTPYEVTELSYDSKAGKVAKVVRYPIGNQKAAVWSKFTYDAKANLVTAVNSDKKQVRLFYDMNGRIRSMVDQSKRRIDFKYNENSKPIEITDPALGSITVTYSNTGEIKKVDSTAGRKIAVQVTSAFQNLLDIIRPAGVSLSF